MSDIKVCQLLDLNCGPLASKATALPTEPPSLPYNRCYRAYRNGVYLDGAPGIQSRVSQLEDTDKSTKL